MDEKLIDDIHSAMRRQCQSRGYAAPVDVLMGIGILSKQKYADWRFGCTEYPERVCSANLKKVSQVMHEVRLYAQKCRLLFVFP